jgi:uncharacterized integral membrane protein
MCGGSATHFNYGVDDFEMSAKSKKPKVRGRGDTRFGVGTWSQLLAIPLYFLLVAAAAGSAGLLKSLRYWAGDWTWPFIVVIFGGAFLCACIGARLGASDKRKTQTLRDAEATMSGSRALYLRTFFSDTKIQFPNPYVDQAFGVSFDLTTLDGEMLPAEVFVGRVLEPFLNVVQVGGSPATIGPGRIYTSDAEWQDAVRPAVLEADVIVILPIMGLDRKTKRLAGRATIWEMEHLVRSGRIERAVVIMPPRLSIMWFPSRVRDGWERARALAAEFALYLPASQRRGGVFIFHEWNGDWLPTEIVIRTKRKRERLAAALQEAVKRQAIRHRFQLLER